MRVLRAPVPAPGSGGVRAFPSDRDQVRDPRSEGSLLQGFRGCGLLPPLHSGRAPPPRPEDKKLPLVEPKVAETTPKSRPPVKESIGEAEVSGVKEEEREGEIEPSSSVKEEEEKVSRKEKKKRDRGEENPSEEARPRRETRSERSRSRRSRSSREALQRT